MNSIESLGCAAVFGASGGIGRALVDVLASRGLRVWAGSRSGEDARPGSWPFRFDLESEPSIAAAAERMRDDPPRLAIIATGALTLPGGTPPERRIGAIDPEAMAQAFRINTIGPALIAKHILPLFPREGPAVLAALSARVGSIEDNRLGGWHSYRASKAALNMLVRNFAIETARTRSDAIVVALHPGTVDTGLSEPFQANVPPAQLTRPEQSASNLVDVIARLRPEDSGRHLDYRGENIPA